MVDISYEKLLDSLFDGVYVVDRDRRISFWNKAAERITGFSRAEVLGSSCADNILRHTDDEGNVLCMGGCPLSASMEDGDTREVKVYLHHKQGHRVPISVRVSPVRDDAGAIIGAIEIFTDNSSLLQILEEMERIRQEAYIDALTKIGNRRYGEMILQTRFYEYRSFGLPFSIIMFDIDHFKQCNDTYGHHTGDMVLAMVARTVSNIIRKMDTFCRWGGEEFVIILPGIDEDDLGHLSERIRLFIEQSFFMLDDRKIAVTASLGATSALVEETPEILVNRVDGLMYTSKSGGRNRVTMG